MSRIQIADNKTKDEALAQFYHVRDECQTNHAVRAVFAACASLHIPADGFPPWQFLGMLHVVALAHALNRTVIMMDAGPQMTCGAYGYQAVRAVAASLLALQG